MSLPKFILVAIAVLFMGCGVQTKQAAKRTLTGVSRDQALLSAQHTLAKKGLDVEKLSIESGEITSAWDGKPRRQMQYKVTVAPAAGADVESLVISVSANSREKVVGGWSEPEPAASNYSDDLLDDIVEMSIDRFGTAGGEIALSPSGQRCATSAECPEGAHCGSGRCVSECGPDIACEAGKVCDPKGRCVMPEPAPCPEFPPPPPPEEDGKKERKKKHDKEGEEGQQ